MEKRSALLHGFLFREVGASDRAVCQGLLAAAYSAAIGPALASAHADLATYLAAVVVSLFDPAQLQTLPDALAGFRRLADPTHDTNAVCH